MSSTPGPPGRPGPTLDAHLVRRLVAAQHPAWAHLEVRPVPVQGNDNRSFRLGPDLLVRLPSARGYAPAVAKEQAWLPRLAPLLPVPVPVPVAAGVPGEGYDLPWSVLRWVPGRTVLSRHPADWRPLALDLAAFVRALQGCPTDGAPAAGAHSFRRGEHPSVYDDDVRRCLPLLAGAPGVDVAALERRWEEALSTRWQGPPRWFHGDLAAGNVLLPEGPDGGHDGTEDGTDPDRLAGVVDFGTSGVGDPACDVYPAWTVLDAPARELFREAAGWDDGTWERGAAWVLWKAALTAVDDPASRGEALRLLRLLQVAP